MVPARSSMASPAARDEMSLNRLNSALPAEAGSSVSWPSLGAGFPLSRNERRLVQWRYKPKIHRAPARHSRAAKDVQDHLLHCGLVARPDLEAGRRDAIYSLALRRSSDRSTLCRIQWSIIETRQRYLKAASSLQQEGLCRGLDRRNHENAGLDARRLLSDFPRQAELYASRPAGSVSRGAQAMAAQVVRPPLPSISARPAVSSMRTCSLTIQ